MSKERKPRKLTMLHAIGYDYKRQIPSVTLAGLWLKEYGFQPGDKISVELDENGRLIITKIASAQ